MRHSFLPFQSATFCQFYAVSCACLLTFGYGLAIGWPSSALPRLQAENSPLPSGPITLNEASWIGSILFIGGFIVAPFAGWYGNYFGRKVTIISVAFPYMLSWILILTAQNVYFLYISRMLGGLSSVGLFQNVPMMVSEIADDHIRGALGSLIILAVNFGAVVGYAVSGYLDFFTVPWIPITVAVIFLAGFYIVPESPNWLVTKNRMAEAEESIKFYKGLKGQPETIQSKAVVMAAIESALKSCKKSRERFQWSELQTKSTRKGAIIAMCTTLTGNFCGPWTLSTYYGTLFADSGSFLSPEMSTILIGIGQFLGALCATSLVERAGRRKLFLNSAYGSAICLILVGIYSYLRTHGVDMSTFSFIPVTFLSVLVFLAACGVTSLQMVIIGEIFPQHLRSIFITIAMMTGYSTNFMLVKIFPYLMQFMGVYGALWFYAVVCSCLASVIFFILPETKGKSIESITEVLGK